MSLRTGILLLSFLTLHSLPSIAQAPASDAKAVVLLNQSLTASGAGNVGGFTASGSITYFWAGQAIQSNATIRAKGGNQFRLDADVPGGTRSVALSRRSGKRKDADGKLTEIPAHNTTSLGGTSFPYLSIAAVLNDPAYSIAYVGLADVGVRQAHQVRVTKIFPKDTDPDGVLAKLSQTDYFIDPQSSLVVKTADFTHPIENLNENYLREMELDSYTAMKGVAVPTIVREKIAGQTTWEFRLSTITFNTTLTDAYFVIQ